MKLFLHNSHSKKEDIFNKLIDISASTGAVIVVADYDSLHYVSFLAAEREIEIPDPIMYVTLLYELHSANKKKYLISDMEILCELFHIDAVTMNKDFYDKIVAEEM